MRARLIRREDIGRVADLRVDLLQELGTLSGGRDAEQVREATRSFLQRRWHSGGHFTSVAAEEGRIVGVGSLEVFERLPYLGNLSGKEGYVLNVYVEPAARQRGIAAELVTDLLGIAGEEGVGRLWLHASGQGRGIYESAGFEGHVVDEMHLVLDRQDK